MTVPADVTGYGNPCSSFKDVGSFQPNAITATSQLWSGKAGVIWRSTCWCAEFGVAWFC